MVSVSTPTRPLAAPDLRAFFHESVDRAVQNQRVEADHGTVWYLANLLTDYSRSERVFDHTEEGITLRPLALLYAQAVEASGERERRLALRRLGDLALFVAGLFSGTLARRMVDVDYCVRMGGSAYAYLYDRQDGTQRDGALAPVFYELSCQFQRFVEVLAEVGEQRRAATDDQDLLRLYAAWLRTRDPRLERRLRGLGIDPQAAARIQ
jgi:hypothetical protein